MKRNKIIFWIVTGLFSAFILFASLPDIYMSTEAVAIMGWLGYPKYLLPFIGIAKVLGVLAILIPGFPRIKEWAYAGLSFDLIGATYSQIATGGMQPGVLLFMVFPIGFLITSYVFYHRLSAAKA